jgi:tetratricopeptide (TPR) repeat protein
VRQALALRRELAAAEPTLARRHDLAETLQALAQLFFVMPGRFSEAKALLDEAGGIWEELVQDRPAEDKFRVALANNYSNLGHFHEWSRPSRPDDADAVYHKAEPLLQALVQKKPGQIEWAASLASLYSRQGNILFQKSPELALARFTSALDTVQALLKQEPRYAPAQLLLLHAHGGRAYAFERLSRFKEAVPEWDRVVELEDRPSHKPFRRSERAVTLARTGDHLRAAAEAEELTAKGPVTNEVLYNAACAYSVAVAAALQDEQLTPTQRKMFGEKYAVRGIALLSRLRTTGFFKTTGYIKQVQEDADFEPLRRRPDCQQLLRDIEQDK